MKQYTQEPGNRLVKGNDFEAVQEIALMAEAFFSEFGNFIISGCVASGTAISSGIVMLNGKACTFNGLPNVTFPYYIKQAVEVENVSYQSGAGTGPGYNIYKAVQATASEQGAFRLDNGVRFADIFKPKQAIRADSAATADEADVAYEANHATNADNATNANKATRADSAANADNANTVGGRNSSQLLHNSYLTSSSNIDTIADNGVYRISTESVGGTFPDIAQKIGCTLFHTEYDVNSGYQLLFSIGRNRVWYREKTEGNYKAWVNIADGGNAITLAGKKTTDFASYGRVNLPTSEIPTTLPNIASVHVPSVEYSAIITIVDFGGIPLQLKLKGYEGKETIEFRTPINNQWRRVVLAEPNGDIVAFKTS